MVVVATVLVVAVEDGEEEGDEPHAGVSMPGALCMVHASPTDRKARLEVVGWRGGRLVGWWQGSEVAVWRCGRDSRGRGREIGGDRCEGGQSYCTIFHHIAP